MLDKYEMTHDEKKHFVNNQLTSISSTFNTVDEYLEFIKFQSDKNLNLEKVNLNSLLKEIKDDLFSELKSRLITVKIIHNKNINIITNQNWLKKSIYNLVLNAVNFAKDGSNIDLSIESSVFGTYILISGTGKSSVDRKVRTTFRNFENINKTTTKIGVDVAFSSSIIENFGGDLKVSSNESIGSDFAIYLPNKPKRNSLKKIIFSMAIASGLLFLFISFLPLYPQHYLKNSQSGYDVYKFEDGSVVLFKDNSIYKLSAKKNLYSNDYRLYVDMSKGQGSFDIQNNKASIIVNGREFKNLGTDFRIFSDKNSRLSVYEGIVKSGDFFIKDGEGLFTDNKVQTHTNLITPVENIKLFTNYFTFDKKDDAVKYEILVSDNDDFSNIQDSFFTTKNNISLNLKEDKIYFIKIYAYDKNGLPSKPKTFKYMNLSHYAKALDLIKNKDIDEAELELETSLLTVEKLSSLPYFEMAKIYFKHKDYKTSIKYTLAALEIDKDLEYYLLLFKNHYKLDNLVDVKKDITSVLLKYPNNLDLLYYKSIVLYKEGNYIESEKTLFKVIESNPYYKGANMLMSELLEKTGNKKISQYYKKFEK
jgi:hypothetical protein